MKAYELSVSYTHLDVYKRQAGETAGHTMGTNRLGSCSITDVFVFGRIAGANAAAFA